MEIRLRYGGQPGSQKSYFTHINDVASVLVLVDEIGRGNGYDTGSVEPYAALELKEMIGFPVKISP